MHLNTTIQSIQIRNYLKKIILLYSFRSCGKEQCIYHSSILHSKPETVCSVIKINIKPEIGYNCNEYPGSSKLHQLLIASTPGVVSSINYCTTEPHITLSGIIACSAYEVEESSSPEVPRSVLGKSAQLWEQSC